MPSMRFLSYNIRLALEAGINAVVDTIREINADIIALQEVGEFWPMGPQLRLTDEIAKAAAYPHSVFAGALHEKGGDYGIGLISRWPITNPGKILLPQCVDEQRIILHAQIPQKNLSLWTTHLSVVQKDRDNQIRWVLGALEKEKPDIFMGDLNTSLSDPQLARIPMLSTFTDPAPATYPTHAPTTTIDHILYGPRLSLYKEAQTYDSRASDHLPVFAELESIE